MFPQQGGGAPPPPRPEQAIRTRTGLVEEAEIRPAGGFLTAGRAAQERTSAPRQQPQPREAADAQGEVVASSSPAGTPSKRFISSSKSSSRSRSPTRTTVLRLGGRPTGGHDRHHHEQRSSGGVLDEDRTCWPLLPGHLGAASSSSATLDGFRARSSCWLSGCCLQRRTQGDFALGDAGSWPSLDHSSRAARFSGGSGGGISLASSSSSSSLTSSLSSSTQAAGDDCVLGSTRTSTQQQHHKHEGGGYPDLGSSSTSGSSTSSHRLWNPKPTWERSTSRGWARLPPIVMVDQDARSKSNNNKRGFGEIGGVQQQEQGQQQQDQDHGMSPVLLMLNTDFIVTSPVRENLLLTLALTQKPADYDHCCEASGSRRERRQVLVGRFEALSSFLRFGLSRDAKRVVTECNAGGTSTISESLSVEYFVRRFQARDVVTEMEVEYCAMNWKKVDYICNLYGQRVGVSVTRAMSYPNPRDFSPQMAYRLLYKKLFGLVVARHGVTERHSFSRCILHVWCETRTTAKILEAQYKDISEELEIADDVIMVLTVAEGWHARPIFYESCLTC